MENIEQESAATKIKRQQYEQKRRDKIAQGFHSLRDFLEVDLALGPIDSNTQALFEAEHALRILTTLANSVLAQANTLPPPTDPAQASISFAARYIQANLGQRPATLRNHSPPRFNSMRPQPVSLHAFQVPQSYAPALHAQRQMQMASVAANPGMSYDNRFGYDPNMTPMRPPSMPSPSPLPMGDPQSLGGNPSMHSPTLTSSSDASQRSSSSDIAAAILAQASAQSLPSLNNPSSLNPNSFQYPMQMWGGGSMGIFNNPMMYSAGMNGLGTFPNGQAIMQPKIEPGLSSQMLLPSYPPMMFQMGMPMAHTAPGNPSLTSQPQMSQPQKTAPSDQGADEAERPTKRQRTDGES